MNLCTSMLKGIIMSASHANWGCSKSLIHVHTVLAYFIDAHINSRRIHSIKYAYVWCLVDEDRA